MYSTIQIKILFHASKYSDIFTADNLGDSIGVSSRTIKREMPKIKEISKDFGLEIQTVPGKGYNIFIKDPDKYREMYYMYLVREEFFSENYTASKQRVNRIILTLLKSHDIITIDQISESLFINRNSIQNELKEAFDFLESYNIKITNKIGVGILVEGNESNIRAAYTELFGIHFNSYTVDTNDPLFSTYEFEYSNRQEIRQILLKNLREHRLVLSDLESQEISIYLLVSVNRNKSGDYIKTKQSIDNPLFQKLSKKILLEIAKNIDNEFIVNDGEIEELMKLLIVHSDVGVKNIFNETNTIKSAKLQAEKMWKQFLSQNALINEDMNNYKGVLSVISKMFLMKEFGFHTHRRNPMLAKQSSECYFSNYISVLFFNFFNKVFNCVLSTNLLVNFQVNLQNDILSYKLNYEKQNIVICSSHNITNAKNTGNILNNNLNKYIKNIDCYNLYDLRSQKSRYDLVIIDISKIYYLYETDVYALENDNFSEVDIANIKIKLAKKAYSLFKRFGKSSIRLKEGINLKSIRELSLVLTTQMYEDDFNSSHKILDEYFTLNEFNPTNNIIPIFIKDSSETITIVKHVIDSYPIYLVTFRVNLNNMSDLKELVILSKAFTNNVEIAKKIHSGESSSIYFNEVARIISLYT